LPLEQNLQIRKAVPINNRKDVGARPTGTQPVESSARRSAGSEQRQVATRGVATDDNVLGIDIVFLGVFNDPA